MAVATSTALIAGGAALASTIGGAIAKSSSGKNTKELGAASYLEDQANKSRGQSLTDFTNLVNAGPGQADVSAGSQASRDLASMLQQYQQGGNIPTQADLDVGNQFAGRAFQAQRLGIQQNFQDAQQQYAQQAALQGRNTLDPVFRNKQNIEQQRQLAMLGAQQGQFANQFAMQQPGERLGYAGQRANVLGGLASQALANRQALFNMGNQLATSEQNFRLGAAGSRSEQSSGGGVGGAIAGGLAGLGSAAGILGGGIPGLPGVGASPMPSGGGGGGSPFSLMPSVRGANPFGLGG